jgi:hypothetical protein
MVDVRVPGRDGPHHAVDCAMWGLFFAQHSKNSHLRVAGFSLLQPSQEPDSDLQTGTLCASAIRTIAEAIFFLVSCATSCENATSTPIATRLQQTDVLIKSSWTTTVHSARLAQSGRLIQAFP